jgi:tRNA(Ile)-lysidine synthetase-like protein
VNRFESDLLAQIQRRGDGVSGRVLVACSGGGDSVALLVLLWTLRKSLGLDLSVAHVDHGLRQESPEEADFVRQLCRTLDLDLAEASLGVRAHAEERHVGLEMAARELRWDWLRQEADQCGASAVATGHTLDDHTETVFLRLARGGGLGCLHPLAPRQELRWSPLAEIRRDALRAYLADRNLPWREDASNKEPFTARNRWRPLLDEMRKEAPNLDRHLFETHLQADEAEHLARALIAGWEGSRWFIADGAITFKRETWTERDLRWTLEMAFRRLDWPRESTMLRNLAPWLAERLAHGRKPSSWGNFHLNPEPGGGYLHLRQEAPPSRT